MATCFDNEVQIAASTKKIPWGWTSALPWTNVSESAMAPWTQNEVRPGIAVR